MADWASKANYNNPLFTVYHTLQFVKHKGMYWGKKKKFTDYYGHECHVLSYRHVLSPRTETFVTLFQLCVCVCVCLCVCECVCVFGGEGGGREGEGQTVSLYNAYWCLWHTMRLTSFRHYFPQVLSMVT